MVIRTYRWGRQWYQTEVQGYIGRNAHTGSNPVRITIKDLEEWDYNDNLLVRLEIQLGVVTKKNETICKPHIRSKCNNL